MPFLLAFLLGAGPAAAETDEAQVEDIDYVALAARLLADEHYDRAAAALSQVDTKDPGLDLRRFFALQGIIGLHRKAFDDAVSAFRRAINARPPKDPLHPDGKPRHGKPEPRLWLYLAQAHFGSEEWKQCLTALRKGGETLNEEAAAHFMRAQASWSMKRPADTLDALVAGEERFPDMRELTRMRVFYMVELGLFQEAMELGQHYLARAEATATDYVAVAEALRHGKQADKAGLILESAHLRFSEDERVLLALAHTYIDRDRPLAAAGILEDAARLNPKFTVEAAELYKTAGRLERALYLNARVLDQGAKFRQRLSILLAMERFEMVAGMGSTLQRLGLLEDEDIRYALAYGLYKTRDFDGAENHLKRLSGPKLFDSANQLRKAMERCRETGWQCI